MSRKYVHVCKLMKSYKRTSAEELEMVKTRKHSGHRSRKTRTSKKRMTRRMKGGDNLGTKFLKEKTDEIYQRARIAFVVKDLLAALFQKQGCEGTVQLTMEDPEGLKKPILQQISDEYSGKVGKRFFGLAGPKERNIAIKQAVDSVLNGTPMECKLIPMAIEKLQRFYKVVLPGETKLSDSEEYEVPLSSLTFLQSEGPDYANYKNIPLDIVKYMLEAEKGDMGTLKGFVIALKSAPELGLTAAQLKQEYADFVKRTNEKGFRLRDNHFMYLKFLKELKGLQAKGIPIEKDYIIDIATSVNRESLSDILARILAYAKRYSLVGDKLMGYLRDPQRKSGLLSNIRNAQEKGIGINPVVTGSLLDLTTQ